MNNTENNNAELIEQLKRLNTIGRDIALALYEFAFYYYIVHEEKVKMLPVPKHPDSAKFKD